jgi:hypothetical protein
MFDHSKCKSSVNGSGVNCKHRILVQMDAKSTNERTAVLVLCCLNAHGTLEFNRDWCMWHCGRHQHQQYTATNGRIRVKSSKNGAQSHEIGICFQAES